MQHPPPLKNQFYGFYLLINCVFTSIKNRNKNLHFLIIMGISFSYLNVAYDVMSPLYKNYASG